MNAITRTDSHEESRRKRTLFEIYREKLDLQPEILLTSDEMKDLLTYLVSIPLEKVREIAEREDMPTCVVSVARALEREVGRGATKTAEMLFDRIYGTPEMRMKMDAKMNAELSVLPDFTTRTDADNFLKSYGIPEEGYHTPAARTTVATPSPTPLPKPVHPDIIDMDDELR